MAGELDNRQDGFVPPSLGSIMQTACPENAVVRRKERNVSNLTIAQLEKKRAVDRQSQRASRERRAREIVEYEQQIVGLKQQTVGLMQQIEDLQGKVRVLTGISACQQQRITDRDAKIYDLEQENERARQELKDILSVLQEIR